MMQEKIHEDYIQNIQSYNDTYKADLFTTLDDTMSFSYEDCVGIFGWPDIAYNKEYFPDIRSVPEGVLVKISNKKEGKEFIGMIYILKKHCLYIDGIFLTHEMQWKWLWKKIMSELIVFAQKLWYTKIKCNAHRNQRKGEFGHYVRPRYGFDGLQNSQRFRDWCDKHNFLHCDTILDLMERSAGRDAWKEHWFSFPATFDCTPGSRSMQIWQNYYK